MPFGNLKSGPVYNSCNCCSGQVVAQARCLTGQLVLARCLKVDLSQGKLSPGRVGSGPVIAAPDLNVSLLLCPGFHSLHLMYLVRTVCIIKFNVCLFVCIPLIIWIWDVKYWFFKILIIQFICSFYMLLCPCPCIIRKEKKKIGKEMHCAKHWHKKQRK